MSPNRRSMIVLQNAVLIFMATLIAAVVFVVDLNVTGHLAVACMYAVVILYSWLLPGKYTSLYIAGGCTVLTIIAATQSQDLGSPPISLTGMNMVISLVVIWTCVTLVFIAKSSFSSLEGMNTQLKERSVELLEKIKELDAQQQELADQKVRLEHLNADLVVKNRELERFTSIASHDLQEPLHTIGNMTQLISKRYYSTFDDQGKKILNYVSEATGRMTVLIKGLLEFSRIGNKRVIERVDCQEMMQTIVLDLDAALKAAKGTIIIRELPVISGNPVELRLLFQNLISNALKFRKEDQPPVIDMSAKDKGTHVEFCIKDNGIGIEPADYEKIFFIFQRLHPAEKYEGIGLGLAYCRKIVELHGGKIWVNSTVAVGSTFYFTLVKNR